MLVALQLLTQCAQLLRVLGLQLAELSLEVVALSAAVALEAGLQLCEAALEVGLQSLTLLDKGRFLTRVGFSCLP